MKKREGTYFLTNCSLTKPEYIKLSFIQTTRNRHGAIILAGFILVLIICSMTHLLYMSLLFVILVPILLYCRLNLMYNRTHKESSGQEPMVITIGPDGFGVNGAGLNAKIDWKYAKSCKDTDKYIFLRFKNARNLFVIPKRVFPSETDAATFVHDLQTYISK